MQRRFALVVVLCVLAAAIGWSARTWLAGKQLGADGGTLDTAGTPAPALRFTTLDGKSLALADLRGKLVLVNFWATWCAPCMDELPLLVQAQKQFGARGLQIVGPALDDAAAVRGMVRKLGIGYPVSADYTQSNNAMTVLGDSQGALPFSVFIDPQGRIIGTKLGGLHQIELLRLIEQNLPKQPAGQ